MLMYIIPAAATIISAVLAEFFLMPAWSLHSPTTCFLLLGLVALFFGLHILIAYITAYDRNKTLTLVCSGIVGALAVIMLLGFLIGLPLFRAKGLSNVIGSHIVTEDLSNLTTTLAEASIMDKDTAENLALREMGTLTDLVSQFNVQGSTQITLAGAPTRVMPLDYAGVTKWFGNRETGVPAYIKVDMRTQDTEIVMLDAGMKFTPNACLFSNLERHVHFKYRTAILGEPSFELDEEMNPWWVIPVLRPTVGLFNGTDVVAVVLVNPMTGDMQKLSVEEVPSWVDRVYPADVVISQYNVFGSLNGGALNSIFGQKGVVQTSTGYNYICDAEDTFVYTGVTSVSADESNIGFIFTNLRTKQTRYFVLPGAEEFSAMAAAEGAIGVAQFGYQATFPLMLVIEGTPTYCMSLKDESGLVRMYAMVNVNKYQLVATGETLDACQKSYHNLVTSNDVTIAPSEEIPIPGGTGSAETSAVVSGVLQDIREGVKDGTTYFYLKLEGIDDWYVLSLTESEAAIKLNTSDTVHLLPSGAAADGIIPCVLQSYEEGAPWWGEPFDSSDIEMPTDNIVPPQTA